MKTPICLLLHMEVPPRLRPDLCRSRLHLLPEYAAYFPHVLFMVSEAIPKTCSMQRKMVTGCGQLWMLWGAGTIRKSADLSGKDMVEMVDRSPGHRVGHWTGNNLQASYKEWTSPALQPKSERFQARFQDCRGFFGACIFVSPVPGPRD